MEGCRLDGAAGQALTCLRAGSCRRDAGELIQRYRFRSRASAQLQHGAGEGDSGACVGGAAQRGEAAALHAGRRSDV